MVRVFVAGATGYIGRALIPLLAHRGHSVTALVRSGSEGKLPSGCTYLIGNALDPVSFATKVPATDVLIHLVGVPHPSPLRARQFREIDQVSLNASVAAARIRNIPQFVYLSVAQPAPVMRAFVQVRAECEQTIRQSGLNASIFRPWYILGPGHRWPLVLKPVYLLFERIPGTGEAATRLGLITIDEMINALAWAVENPPTGIRVTGVAAMRRIPRLSRTSPGTAMPGQSATHG